MQSHTQPNRSKVGEPARPGGIDAAGSGIQLITDKEFALFQSMIRKESGIHLSEAKKQLLVGRLSRRLRELGLKTFGAYYRVVNADGGGEERRRMVDCICTNETQFFREPRQFEILEREIIPKWKAQAATGRRPKRLRIWSAACSTGEEPFSVAMTLLHNLSPAAGWQIEMLATDLSERALQTAQHAIWPVEKANQIPRVFLKEFMLQGMRSQEGKMKAGPEIRSIINFQRCNLNDESYPVQGQFDLILCRNVLIYFNADSKVSVIKKLLNHLTPQGYLFLGHSESLNGMSNRVRSVGPTMYVRIQESGSSHAMGA
jgi:chemotaxis protein methyltransferase CheR